MSACTIDKFIPVGGVLPAMHGNLRKSIARLLPLAGTKDGRWTILAIGQQDGGRPGIWLLAECDCGTKKVLDATSFIAGDTKSCGCLHDELRWNINFKHGMSDTKEFRAWQSMIRRCEAPKEKQFPNYGGRGISVCHSWRNSFSTFYADMGNAPSESHSVDRINVNGNYEPSNCRWATWTEQNRNRRNNTVLTFNGKTQCLAAWCEELGITIACIQRRMKLGLAQNQIFAPKNRSGLPTGVTWHPKTSKWRARVVRNGVPNHLGLFATIDEANQVVKDFSATNPDGRSRERVRHFQKKADPDPNWRRSQPPSPRSKELTEV